MELTASLLSSAPSHGGRSLASFPSLLASLARTGMNLDWVHVHIEDYFDHQI